MKKFPDDNLVVFTTAFNLIDSHSGMETGR